MLFSNQIRELAEKLYSVHGGSPLSTYEIENYLEYNYPYIMKDISQSDIHDIQREYRYIGQDKRFNSSPSKTASNTEWSTNYESRTNSNNDYYYDDYDYSTMTRPGILQMLVVIVSILICIYLGRAFFDNYLYNDIVDNAHHFLYIIIGQIVLHFILAKPLQNTWCFPLNAWNYTIMFMLYHFYLVATLFPNSSIKEVALAILIGEVLNVFLVLELQLTDEADGLLYFFPGVVHFFLPIVSAFCHDENVFNELLRSAVFIVFAILFLISLNFTITSLKSNK